MIGCLYELVVFTISTGHGASRTILSAVDPSRN